MKRHDRVVKESRRRIEGNRTNRILKVLMLTRGNEARMSRLF